VPQRKRRFQATRDLPGGFLIALRSRSGELLSVVGDWRQGTTTVLHHQMNAAGYEKDSLSTVMRSYFLENEIQRGTRTVIFYHGTNDTISHAFEAETTRDLIVRRKSFYAYFVAQTRELPGFSPALCRNPFSRRKHYVLRIRSHQRPVEMESGHRRQ
jgi:hypothetical protein